MNTEEHTIYGPSGEELHVIVGTGVPHCLDAEQYLLSCILLDDTGQAWAIAQNCGVKKNAFHEPGAGVVYDLVSELRRRGEASVDLAMVVEELNLRGVLDSVGGMEGVLKLTRLVGSTMNVRYYAELVVLTWQRRYQIVLAGRLREGALEFNSREEFAGAAGQIGQKLIGLGRKEMVRTLPEIFDAVEGEARARNEGTVDRSRWVSSGLAKFDQINKRFGSAMEDGFIVIAGGSGHGKSVTLRQIALAGLEEKKTVLSYSRETSTAGFLELMLGAKLGINLNTIEQLPRLDMERFYAECQRQRNEWANRTLFCVEHNAATPLLTVEDLCEHARAHVQLHGLPHVILVDYLQIFGTRKRMPSREAEVGFVSHALQALQRELGCVVAVAVQLNESGLSEQRKATYDDNNRLIHRLPKPGDLRESQAIYHDADRMIFLYRPPVDSLGRDQSSPSTARPEMWWYQEKRRRGGNQSVRCWFEKKYTRFVAFSDDDTTQANLSAAVATGKLEKGTMVPKSQFMGGEST